MTKEDVKIEDSNIEATKTDSTPKVEEKKEDSKPEASKKAPQTPISQDKKDDTQVLDSLKGQISARDKELNELRTAQQRMQNKMEVSQKLLDDDIPADIKNELKKEIDNLTPESYDLQKERLLNIYNLGMEAKKQETINFMGRRPEKTVPQDFDSKIKEIDARDPKAIEKLKELGRSLN